MCRVQTSSEPNPEFIKCDEPAEETPTALPQPGEQGSPAGRIVIPAWTQEILQRLHNAGYEAYVVGGCVRDSLLGREPEDWDVTTSATPQEVKSLFSHTVDTGIQHGTVTVLLRGETCEITTYRIDGNYADGRHPDQVTFTSSLLEDLKRRDFTINAMAYSSESGLVDEFDGLGDLGRGVIRAVGDPRARFEEDALRMMRAIRFAAQLGYEIEEETRAAIRSLSQNLQKVSAERVRAELDKILVSDHPGVLRDAYQLGLTDVFLPELSACMECPQNTPHHACSAGEHILRSVENVRADRILRLTMLLHDIAKPQSRTTDENGIDHFWGHAALGADMADSILRRLKYDNDTRRTVVKLVRWHDHEPGESRPRIRHIVADIGEDLFPLLLEVKTADITAQSEYGRDWKMADIEEWRRAYCEIRENGDCLSLKTLAYSGKDLLAAGIKPGEQVGRILNTMFEDVLTDPSHNTKEYLIRYIPQVVS